MSNSTRLKAKSLLSPFLFIALLAVFSVGHADYYKDAQGYFDQGDYKSAIIQLKNALQKNSENLEARILLGKVYLKAKEPLNAAKELEKAQTINANSPGWVLPLSKAYLASNQLEKAIAIESKIELLENTERAEVLANIGHAKLLNSDIAGASEKFVVSRLIADTPMAIVGQARIALLEHRFEESITLSDSALQLNPEHIDALYTKAQALANLGQMEDAIKTIDKLLLIEPERHQARYMRANLLLSLGNIEQATKDVVLILEEKPNFAPANIVRARLYLLNNEYALAQQTAEKVLRRIPEHLMTHYVLGASHYAQQNYEQSKIYLEKFLNTLPSHLLANRVLSAVYLALQDEQSAISLIEAFTETYQKEDAKLLSILGTAYLRTGNFEQGVATLNRSLELDPSIHDARINLAYGYIGSGDIGKASEGLEEFTHTPASSEKANTLLILTHLKQKKYADALTLANESLKKYPTVPTFHILKGLVFEAQGKTQDAKAVYLDVLDANINPIPAHFALAQLDLKASNLEGAQQHFQHVIDLEPSHLEASIRLAQIANAKSDDVNAVKWMERAKNYHPESIKPANLLVTYFLSKGDTLKALNEANRFYSENKKNLSALSLMALVYSARKEYSNAKDALNEILAASPTDINHRLQLAQLHFVAGEYDEALASLDEVLYLEPRNTAALVAKATLLIKQGNVSEARKARDLHLSYYPDSFINDQLLGDILVAENNPSEAIGLYRQAFQQQKTNYLLDALLNLYTENQQYSESVKLLEAFLSDYPEDNYSRLKLAGLYQQQQQNEKAIAQYEKLSRTIPNNALVLNNLSWLYWLEGSELALQTAAKAFEIVPDNVNVADTYGWIMLHKGDKKQALTIIQNAASKAPHDPGIRFHLAKALSENGKSEMAEKELSRILRDFSSFEQRAKALALQEKLSRTR